MGEMSSLWDYEEEVHDMELGQKLLFTTLELENLKSEAKEEMRKNKEYVKQLIHLLKSALQERDEARNQLQNLLNKTMPLSTTVETFLPPLMNPKKPNSSITESNSLSETFNYQSHDSSPVDQSLFDAVSSPEFSNINNTNAVPNINNANTVPSIDRCSLVMDSLVKGRDLPQKGKFLQAVLEAGPLLKTLLVAGPLPRWRNPPQLQPFQIPAVTIKGCENGAFAQKQASNVGQLGSRSVSLKPYGQISCGLTQAQSAPMLSFGTNCLSNGSVLSSGINSANGYVHMAKRQRFC